ncbi:MAG: hypothetical protein Q9170_005390 [Blastenia crenularia]
MTEEHEEPACMRRFFTYRWRNIVVCLITLLLTLQLYHSQPIRSFRIPCSKELQRPCESIAIPAIQKPSPQVSEQWSELQELFEAHPPNLAMRREDFQGGPMTEPSVSLLADYLDMTFQEARVMRREHSSVVQDLPEHPAGAFAGRGIVVLAGGRYSEIAATTLGMIRLLGSRLPVEVWMIDRIEEKEKWCDELSPQKIECRFISDYISDMSAFSHHYQLKIPVIMFSSFNEVLYFDGDSMPVVNPDSVFNAPSYLNNGAVLWPDYWKATESPFTPYITGRTSRKATTLPGFQTVDSGQMLWNKEKHWKSLCLSAYYNYFGPTYFYTLFTQGSSGWGDKDTFPTALRALNASWTLVKHHLETQFFDDGTGHNMGSGMGMMQADPADEKSFKPMFLHSNFVKLSVRRLMCAECVEDSSALSVTQRLMGETVTFKGSIADRTDHVHDQMYTGRRLFATKTKDNLNHMGRLDTEKDIWRVMERVACVGAFSDEKICQRTRRHLGRVFGTVTRWEGGSEKICS